MKGIIMFGEITSTNPIVRTGWLQGYVKTYRSELERVFGEPRLDASFDGKVTCEWAVAFADGTVATIYDWKSHTPTQHEVYQWHIGGTNDRALANVAAALKIANASFALPVPSA